MRVNALCIAAISLLASTGVVAQPAPGAGTSEKWLSYSGVTDFCQQFGGILEPDAPIEDVFVGTFDALTGNFTWGPGAFVDALPPPYVPPGAQPAGWLDAYLRIRNLVESIGLQPLHVVAIPHIPLRSAASVARAQPARVLDPGIIGLPTREFTGHAPDGKAYHFRVRAGQVNLRFRVVNRPSNVPFVVRLDIPLQLGGGTLQGGAPEGVPGDEVVSVVVPPMGFARFSLSVGPNSFEDPIGFRRPPVLGCFTLESFPISYVYEPPGSGSSQAYTQGEIVGTTVKTFTAADTAGTQPRWVPFFSGVEGLAKLLGGLGAVVAIKYPETGKYLTGAGTALTALLGTATESSTVTHKVSDQHQLLVEEAHSETLRTAAHLGPGRGDAIHLLINPVFAWLAAEDEETGAVYLSVTLLSWETDGRPSAEDLRLATPPLGTLIPDATRHALLEVDPLTSEYAQTHPVGPNSNPAPGRFVESGPSIVHAGTSWTLDISHTVVESELHTEALVKTLTHTEESGFLGYLFSGLPQTGSRSLTTTEGTSTEVSAGSESRVTITIETAVGEGVYFQPYFDTLFGTFAFVTLTPGANAIVGRLVSAAGRPTANQQVLLIAGRRRVLARSDANGRFRIPAGGLPQGRYAIMVGSQRFLFSFAGAAETPVSIRLR